MKKVYFATPVNARRVDYNAAQTPADPDTDTDNTGEGGGNGGSEQGDDDLEG